MKYFPTHAQETRVACCSLIIANIVLFQIAKFVTSCFQQMCLPSNRSETVKKIIDLASIVIGYSIALGGVYVFAVKAKLPLAPYVTLGISVVSFGLCALFEVFQNR